jgi:uncharacterized membrane protein
MESGSYHRQRRQVNFGWNDGRRTTALELTVLAEKPINIRRGAGKSMTDPVNATPPLGVLASQRRIHWHVFFTHFPISLFGTAFGFQILHLFMAPVCFELATNVALLGGTVMLMPTVLTGWSEWKARYHSAKGLIFRRKILTAYGMAALSLSLVIWRIAALGIFEEAAESPAHWIYLAGNTGLILGAIVEGYYGGRLNHK